MPGPNQRRFSFQFSLSHLFWAMLVFGLVLAWWNVHRQQEARLDRIEKYLFPKVEPYWAAQKAVGPPDETGFGPNAWCPAQADEGEQWLLLEYDSAVTPTAVEVHETYSTGFLKKVCFLDARDQETVAWEGADPSPNGTTPVVSSVPVKSPRKTKKVKIYVDTDVTGWNCVDAVGLVDAKGKRYWAKSATASSDYGKFSTPVRAPMVFPGSNPFPSPSMRY